MVRTLWVRSWCAALAVASALGADFASAQEERPSTGTGQIVVGWIATGVGAVNLALIPVCYADFYPSEGKDLCVGGSIAFGVVGLGIGIPFLAAGYSNRAEYERWKQQNPTAAELSKLRLSAARNGGFLSYHAEF